MNFEILAALNAEHDDPQSDLVPAKARGRTGEAAQAVARFCIRTLSRKKSMRCRRLACVSSSVARSSHTEIPDVSSIRERTFGTAVNRPPPDIISLSLAASFAVVSRIELTCQRARTLFFCTRAGFWSRSR
jgi:hypothetical protein